ncbi:hypothetical protein TSOC_008438, partial [Tetrabaena socialis]
WLDELIVALWHDLQAFLDWKALDTELAEAGFRRHADIVAGLAPAPSEADYKRGAGRSGGGCTGRGDYGLQVITRAPDGSELACVNVDFTLVLPSASSSAAAASAIATKALPATAAAEAASGAGSAAAGSSEPKDGGGGMRTVGDAAAQHRKQRAGHTARTRRAVL